ncbi:hypothetical protein NC652_037497 [Populus alba x Populus x berolinensis]|nr:hypothetical protein NC652_037497 [Populus alba x Populus x berolinensis]
MDFEDLVARPDILITEEMRLRAKMEKALSLLKDSLGSTGSFFAQFWAKDRLGIPLQNQPYPHLCVPNSTLLEYRQLDGRQRFSSLDILYRAWNFPEWTSNVSYYRPDEYAHLSDAISCGVRGIIAFPVFDPDQPEYFRAVLELVTMEDRQDFDLEKEKVVQALQAANLGIKFPRPRPRYCFNEVQRAALTEIADVTRAVCQTHRLPLALTWIPWRHDDILKLGDISFWWSGQLAIERTACYADEEMQGFVHACEQLFLYPWQGNAGQACKKNIVEIQMDFERLLALPDILITGEMSLLPKMEKALSLLKDSLGSTGSFLAQFWAPGKPGGLQNQPYPHLCVPNSTLLEYRQLDGRQGFSGPDIVGRAWDCGFGGEFPEWTSNVSYYRPNEYAHLSDAISCGVRGIIAFPVFESHQSMHSSDQIDCCCAVLELVTMEEKQDFDLETEKVVQALQAANLGIKLPFFSRPQCFNEVQRAALTEIADVTRAVCQTHRLPLALTWIPWGHDDILKLGDWFSGQLAIERTACYADEEMQGFVHACAQLFLCRGEGAAGQAFLTCLPSFEPNVKEKHVSEYPLAHHARNSKEGKPGSSLVSTDVRFDSPGKQMSKYLAGPFTVSKPTSPEDLKLIQYVFDSSLSESETIVQCKNYHLSRRELYSLRPETWLDDNVLSTISDAMTLVKRKMDDSVNRYLPIVFAANADDPSKCISFAKKHRIKENYMSDLLCCEKAFVPVFDNERRHFFLFVLQLKRQVVEIWDSLAASRQSDWVDRRLHNLLVSLDALFKDDIDQNYQKVWSFTDFRVERPSNVPQQQNGHDCGVYVIKFMLAPEEVTNPDSVFDSENERLEVVLRLLASDVNSCRNDLASKAEAYYEQRFGNH